MIHAIVSAVEAVARMLLCDKCFKPTVEWTEQREQWQRDGKRLICKKCEV